MISKESLAARKIDRMFWPYSEPEKNKLSRLDVQRIRRQTRQELNQDNTVFLISQIEGEPEKKLIFKLQKDHFKAYSTKSNFLPDGNYRLRIRQENNLLFAQLKVRGQKLDFPILGVLGVRDGKVEILADLTPKE